MRCPACRQAALACDAHGQVQCMSCGWRTPATDNYIDVMGSDALNNLANNYFHLFKKLDDGELGDKDLYYSKTAAEELQEFLVETGFIREDIKGKKILDAGCGIARLTEILGKQGADCVALDIHPRLQHYARERRPEDSLCAPLYLRGNIEELPFTACFDLVWCQGVLSYVENVEKAIAELQRVTQQGGLLYLWIYSSASGNILYRIARTFRKMPASIREPFYDLLCWLIVVASFFRDKIKRVKPIPTSQSKLHLRDYSLPEKINTRPASAITNLFDEKVWQVKYIIDNGRIVTFLAEKKA